MLRAGLIGFGRMGITHYSILNTHPSVEIVAVCDRSDTMLKILEKYVDVRIYSDYVKMIDEETLDFVIISTPTDSHAEIIKYAIDNDLHVFTEKPLCLREEELGQIVDLLNSQIRKQESDLASNPPASNQSTSSSARNH